MVAKSASKKNKKSKRSEHPVELIAGPATADSGKKHKKKADGTDAGKHGGVDGLFKLAEHPLVADLLAVGALAAVAAIVEAGKGEPAAAKSRSAARSAGKAAAAAIGARLLKEVTAAGAKKA